ncbi:MAG: IclR family transcriptional regulator [Phenylobacterium sp.]|uniref:IclR family transcriptional regulator n=1 Tax=Phenylobacterium sp. TaxID=1871053 RepID=UPI002734BA37|nr:IclR family transcriptional regulator [Phenylobacterium sp.]MDP3749384.1 IclR family transcriptional regulator [Phenylobacterium sp.]
MAVADKEPAGSRYSVPALEKGLEILELLARSPVGLNVTAIAQQLGRTTGEIYRVIQYLEGRGYLERDHASDLYALSMRLFRLAHEHPPLKSLVSRAVPLMEELANAVGQSCHLAVLDRTSIVIVAQVDSPLPIRYSVRLGAQFPVWETSSGYLIAAFLTPDARRALADQLGRTVDASQIAEFEAKVAEIAAMGYEARQSQLIPGIVNISNPVFGHNGQVAGALTVPFLSQRTNRMSVDATRKALVQTASTLSDQLGHDAGAGV